MKEALLALARGGGSTADLELWWCFLSTEL
jgi:hypothetical protein